MDKKRSLTLGFGLIELMVSISILVLVMSVILARNDTFNSAVLLRSQAYEVALSIREVQLSAISAQGDSGDFRNVMGVYFDTSNINDQQYFIFVDADSDNFYDSIEEYGEQGFIDGRFEISDIRFDGVSSDDVSIIFERPNFDARFYSASGVNSGATAVEIDLVDISSGLGSTKTIEITATGQIGVI